MTRSQFQRAAALVLVAVVTLVTGSCSEEFTPFNRLDDGVRVLAIAAEPPQLVPGGTTELTALVYEPPGSSPVRRWSWCPLSTGAATGYECALTEEQLVAVLPPELASLISFELGSNNSATLVNPVDGPTTQAFCESLFSSEIPQFVSLPDCTRALPVTLRLDLGEAPNAVSAVSEIELLVASDGALNQNPSLGDIYIAREPMPDDGDEQITAEEIDAVTVNSDGSTVVSTDETYRLWIDINPSSAESFVPSPTVSDPEPQARKESLVMTWFTSAGETEFTRTVFTDELPLEDARTNTFTLPSDETSETMQLHIVIRDGRGGIGWVSRTLQLEVN